MSLFIFNMFKNWYVMCYKKCKKEYGRHRRLKGKSHKKMFRRGSLYVTQSMHHKHATTCDLGGGPRVVVSTAAFHARVRGSVPGIGGLKETKNASSPSTCESQYCGEPPWPRGSVLGLRPPGLEFRILCLEDSVISIISPSSGGSPGPA